MNTFKVKWIFSLYLINCLLQFTCPYIVRRRSDDPVIKPEKELRYNVYLDNSKKLQLFWDIDLPTETITFRLEAKIKKTELIGLGFSDYGETENADFITLWDDPRGKFHFQDSFTDQDGILDVDDHQDYILDHVKVVRGVFVIEFHRIFDTCDDQDYMIDDGTTHILYFIATGRPETLVGLNVTGMDPGLQRVQLIKSQLPDPEFPKDTKEFVMHVDNVAIPDKETTYWCKTKKLPELKSKYHIIQFGGAISPQSEGIVHHLEVFHCEVPPSEKVRDYDGPCKTMGAERPEGLEACRKVIGAWAMGAQALTYPPEAGYPIGGEDFSPYVMLEVHYNNPGLISGVVDSSGIKFHITPTLRQFDAGIMELGQEYTDKFALPPGQDLWTLEGYCLPECTQVALPEKGIKVFASQLHTHLTGIRTYTKHFRNGIELPELNRDNHYSPHYQEIRKLKRQVNIMPGDYLLHRCLDSTKDKENLTLTGFEISDEMCVNYIHYYPRTDLEVCKSSVTTDSLYRFFKFLNEYQDEPTSSSMGIYDNYHSINWTPMNIRLTETYYDTAPISMQCNKSDGSRFPGNWEGLQKPKLLHEFPPTERPCLT